LLFYAWKAIQSQATKDYKYVYWGSIVIALLTSISYFTGPTTADWIKEHITTYSKDLIENHAIWGRVAFIISILSGVLGIMALANYAQDEKPPKAIPWILIVLFFINVLVLVYTAHLGGLIRRPDLS